MKNIILTENSINLLLEYAGYVDGFDFFIKKASKDIVYAVNHSLSVNGFDIYSKNKNKLANDYYNSDEINNEKPIYSLFYNEFFLSKKCNMKYLKEIEIRFQNGKDFYAFFSPSETYLDYDNKINKIIIVINPIGIIKYPDEIEETLQHELTHAYELLKQIMKNGEEKAGMNLINRYYNSETENNIVNTMSYYLSKIELNAYLSEFFYHISHSNIPYEKAKNEISKCKIGGIIENIKDIRNKLENNINYTLDIIEFLKLNPEHLDFFPSFKRYNVSSYRKRLLRAVDYKLNYINVKINRFFKKFYSKKG